LEAVDIVSADTADPIFGFSDKCDRHGSVKRLQNWAHSQDNWEPRWLLLPVPREPLYVIERGCCEGSRRLAAGRSAWGHVPADAHAVLKTYGSPRPKDSFGIAVGPLRVEGLPRWSNKPRNSIPECSALGHAARVAAWAVCFTPESILATVGAPEIAHC
jgi:hypothetical protein